MSDGYSYALCVSLTLMLFFAYRFLFGTLPPKQIYQTYKQSRAVMGVAMLVLSANYSVHMFVSPRFFDVDKAIYMNLSTYFLSSWLFSCALMHLMFRGYLTRRRFVRHIALWILYTAGFWILGSSVPEGKPRFVALMLMSVVFLLYSGMLARRLFIALRRIKKMLDSFHSDDIYAYVRWMSIFTYWAIVFGVGQGVFTFIPDKYVVFWIISAIPFYVYLYVSYKNYMLFYEKFEQVSAEASDAVVEEDTVATLPSAQDRIISERLEKWISDKGFAVQGLTISDLARDICTNRTYVSTYINAHYGMPFREWVNGLRIEYAKQLLLECRDMTASDVASKVGYLSLSYFSKTFTTVEGMPPGKWRKLK